MSNAQLFRMAVKNIRSGKLRSFLTMLGIIIGVAAVIVIVGLGNGLERYMTESFQSLGSNLLTVTVRGTSSSQKISETALYNLTRENPGLLSGFSPAYTVPGGVKIGTDALDETAVTGVGEQYAQMRCLALQSGRFLEYGDLAGRGRVCVVGAYLNEVWYGGAAVGQTLRVRGDSFLIVGALAPLGEETGGEGSGDDAVYLPDTAARRLAPQTGSEVYQFAVATEDGVTGATELIEQTLLAFYGTEDAYSVVSMAEMLDTMNEMIGLMVAVLAAIAAISLVVGGIGIMNIMLVSVSERTREIGIWKALGAKQRFILRQFVMEALVTSALGGIAGIVVGYAVSAASSAAVTRLLGAQIAVIPTPSAVVGAVLISAGIGVLFGWLPARKAARLHPIDALQHE